MKKSLILISFFIFALLLSSCDILCHSILMGKSYVKIDLNGSEFGPNGELYKNTYYTLKGTIADGWGNKTGNEDDMELYWTGDVSFPNNTSYSGETFTIKTYSYGSKVTIKAKAVNFYERPEKSIEYKLINKP